MKLVIDIPEEAKLAFDNAESNDLKGCYYDHGGVIGNAIKNGVPLEDALKSIEVEIIETYCNGVHDILFINEVFGIINQHIDEKEAGKNDNNNQRR